MAGCKTWNTAGKHQQEMAGSNPASLAESEHHPPEGPECKQQKLFGERPPAGWVKTWKKSCRQHSAGTGFRRWNNRIVERQFDRAIRSRARLQKIWRGQTLQNTVGVLEVIGQKVAGTQLGGFVGNMGQKAGFGQGLWLSDHCRNGNWRCHGRPRSIY